MCIDIIKNIMMPFRFSGLINLTIQLSVIPTFIMHIFGLGNGLGHTYEVEAIQYWWFFSR